MSNERPSCDRRDANVVVSSMRKNEVQRLKRIRDQQYSGLLYGFGKGRFFSFTFTISKIWGQEPLGACRAPGVDEEPAHERLCQRV